tara:strand:+ start:3573 stop:4106 length:534 start_codon:yes stop_codon:yes gene_type:complete
MNIIDKIKGLFEEEIVETIEATEESVEKVEAADEVVDIKTIEGNILRITEIVEGADVLEITEDGEIMAKDADYTLEDGRVLTVLEGKITAIKEVDEDETTEETEATDPATDEMSMADLMKAFDTLFTKIETLEQSNATLTEKFTKLSGEDAAEATDTVQTFSKEKTREDKLKFFSKK